MDQMTLIVKFFLGFITLDLHQLLNLNLCQIFGKEHWLNVESTASVACYTEFVERKTERNNRQQLKFQNAGTDINLCEVADNVKK